MSIITKVKGVDDFGKKHLYGNVFQYEFHYPRIAKGDFLIFYYPKDNMMGVYVFIKETEYYSKDGFDYCKGEMVRYGATPQDAVDNLKQLNGKMGLVLERTILELVNKHQIK